VSLSFSDAERLPGARTQLQIRADAGSLCAIGVVDKSVHILGGSNQLTLGKVLFHPLDVAIIKSMLCVLGLQPVVAI
jgi:hypothetical protein